MSSSPRRLRSGTRLGSHQPKPDDDDDPKSKKGKANQTVTGSSGQSGTGAGAGLAATKRKRKMADSDSKAADKKNKNQDSKSKVKITQPKEAAATSAMKNEAGPSNMAKPPTSTTTMVGDLDPKSKVHTTTAKAKAKEIAMKNEVILTAIAKQLPTCDLFPLRQTCTPWNRNFVPELVKEHDKIELHTDSSASSGCRGGRPPGRLISEFINIMKSRTNMPLPFAGYSIYDLGLGRQRDLKDFFQIFGKTITRLDVELGLNHLKVTTVQILRQIIFEWTPELRELTIYGTTSCCGGELAPLVIPKTFKKEIPKLRKLDFLMMDGWKHPPIYSLLEDLFECAIGLESLAFEYTHCEAGDILHILRGTGERPAQFFPALSRLKSLKLAELTARHIPLLIELGSLAENPLRLQELDLDIRVDWNDEDEGEEEDEEEDEVDEEDHPEAEGEADVEPVERLVHSFLTTQSSSLRKLDISMPIFTMDDENDRDAVERWRNTASAWLPAMDNLVSLTLQLDVKWQFAVKGVDEHETFVKMFPALKHLEVHFGLDGHPHDVDKWLEIIEATMNKFTHEGVESLKIGYEDYYGYRKTRAPLSFVILQQTWPSLTKLELELNSASLWKSLRAFWTLWPGLISFRVDLGGCGSARYTILDLDELLSGVPATKFDDLRQKLEPALKQTIGMEYLRALQTEYKTEPGLSDLGNLREFILCIDEIKFSITDIGGYLGLAMMSSQAAVVQQVVLEYDKGENRISEACHNFMKSVFGPFTIIDIGL